MASLQTALAIVSSLLILFGQLGRIDIFQYNINLIDIVLPLIALTTLQKPTKTYILLVFFALLSFAIAPFSYLSLKPFLFLIRLLSIYQLLFNSTKFNFQPYINIAIISNIIFGLIQYFVWPDFTYFNSLQWDPHLYRLVSTYFDPTFTGLIYLFFLIYLYKSNYKFKNYYLVIVYIATSLTYSRSTLLALFFAFMFLFLKTKKYLNILFLSIILSITLFILPRMEGEGTKLERTSSIKAKIENYQQAFSLFTKYPILGIGYNNIGSYKDLQNPKSHAANGFDGSLMTILVTTGIIGLFIFTILMSKHFLLLDTSSQTMLIAFIIHSLFANSLLYPFTFIVYIAFIRYRK